jgi:hypothetical protein
MYDTKQTLTTEPQDNFPQIEWERMGFEKEDNGIHYYGALGCGSDGKQYCGTWVDIDFVVIIENIKPTK